MSNKINDNELVSKFKECKKMERNEYIQNNSKQR
jgi:hypothetical protein